MNALSKDNVDVHGELRMEAYKRTSEQFNVKFGLLTTIADERFNMCMDTMEGHRWMKGRVKMYAKRSQKAWDSYLSKLPTAFADKYPTYVDFMQRCYAYMEHDVDVFYYSIKRALDKRRLPETDILAHAITSYELAQLARRFFRIFWETANKQWGYDDLDKPFRYADPTPIANALATMCDALIDPLDAGQIRLDGESDCDRAIRVIIMRVHDADRLDELGIEAMRMNAEHNEDVAEHLRQYEADMERERKEAERAAVDNVERMRESLATELSTKYKVTRQST